MQLYSLSTLIAVINITYSVMLPFVLIDLHCCCLRRTLPAMRYNLLYGALARSSVPLPSLLPRLLRSLPPGIRCCRIPVARDLHHDIMVVCDLPLSLSRRRPLRSTSGHDDLPSGNVPASVSGLRRAPSLLASLTLTCSRALSLYSSICISINIIMALIP
jgi:hypothetical protein